MYDTFPFAYQLLAHTRIWRSKALGIQVSIYLLNFVFDIFDTLWKTKKGFASKENLWPVGNIVFLLVSVPPRLPYDLKALANDATKIFKKI